MLDYKLGAVPIEPNLKLRPSEKNKIVDRECYQRLVGELIHLSHTRLNIAFSVSVHTWKLYVKYLGI